MSSFLKSKFVRVFSIAVLLFQLGVVAFHHHGDDVHGAHTAHASSIVAFALQTESHAGHDHNHGASDHSHGDDHHAPPHDESHDCDLCFLKSAVTHGVLAQASGGVLTVALSTTVLAADQPNFYRDFVLCHFGARAPPREILVS